MAAASEAHTSTISLPRRDVELRPGAFVLAGGVCGVQPLDGGLNVCSLKRRAGNGSPNASMVRCWCGLYFSTRARGVVFPGKPVGILAAECGDVVQKWEQRYGGRPLGPKLVAHENWDQHQKDINL